MSSRFWCKSCEIFIDDNQISKKQHESSEKHKSSVRRAINDLHRVNREEDRQKREEERAQGVYRKHKDKPIGQNGSKSDHQQQLHTTPDAAPSIGEWEEVSTTKPVLRMLGSPLKDPEEAMPLPSIQLNLPPSQMEGKSWNFEDQKKIDDVVSSEDDDVTKTSKSPTITFKKRKVKK